MIKLVLFVTAVVHFTAVFCFQPNDTSDQSEVDKWCKEPPDQEMQTLFHCMNTKQDVRRDH